MIPDIKSKEYIKYKTLKVKKDVARRHLNKCLIKLAEAELEIANARLDYYYICREIEDQRMVKK